MSTTRYVAIEVKRRAGIDAVDQLLRYLECLDRDSSLNPPVRGIVAAQSVAPQAMKYAWSKGIKTVVVDYDELRGMKADDLTLF